MSFKQVALAVGAVAAIFLFGSFAVWLFEYLSQFVPVAETG